MAKSQDSKKKRVPKKKPKIAAQLGLTIPLRHINRLLTAKRYCDSYSVQSLVYFSAVIEYLIAEVLDLCLSSMEPQAASKIRPALVVRAIQDDLELCTFFKSKSVCWTNKQGEVEIVSIDHQSKAKLINKMVFSQSKRRVSRQSNGQQSSSDSD